MTAWRIGLARSFSSLFVAFVLVFYQKIVDTYPSLNTLASISFISCESSIKRAHQLDNRKAKSQCPT